MQNILKIFISIIILFFICSCAISTPVPLTYLSLKQPAGIISTKENQKIKKDFSRGGWYFFNHNFRPAADIKSYIEQAEKTATVDILRHADIRLNVPFYIDILYFGYNSGTDTVSTVAKKN